jgi:hypothetical protein
MANARVGAMGEGVQLGCCACKREVRDAGRQAPHNISSKPLSQHGKAAAHLITRYATLIWNAPAGQPRCFPRCYCCVQDLQG